MTRIARITLATSTALALLGAMHTSAVARAASNPGGGLICYNYPTVAADGKVTYTRVCFKRP
jgi:hypothetical protein